ncbi:ABC transporter related protein, partial [sediment metagenome]
AGEVVAAYLSGGERAQPARTWDFEAAPGNEDVRLQSVSVVLVADAGETLITTRSELDIRISFWNLRPDTSINLSIHLHTWEGVCAFSTWSKPRVFGRGLIQGRCRIPANLLNEGGYRCRVFIVRNANSVLLDVPNTIEFDVHDIERDVPWYGKVPGVVRPSLDWTVDQVPGGSLPGAPVS